MKRLTQYDEFGNADIIGVDSEALQCNLCFKEFNKVTSALNRLAKYEDLEEQGKLLKLPCKVGDRVYVKTQSGNLAEAEVRDFSYFLTCGFCAVVTSGVFDKQHIPFSEFGKTIFTSKCEAEGRKSNAEEKEQPETE